MRLGYFNGDSEEIESIFQMVIENNVVLVIKRLAWLSLYWVTFRIQ